MMVTIMHTNWLIDLHDVYISGTASKYAYLNVEHIDPVIFLPSIVSRVDNDITNCIYMHNYNNSQNRDKQ